MAATPGQSRRSAASAACSCAGIRVGVNEADRHRLHPVSPEVADDAGKRGEVEGAHFVAAVVDAARQLAAQAARHEGFGLAIVQVEEIGPVAARDLQRVAEAPGGDEADLHPGALGQRVDDHRRAVGEKVHRARHDARLRHDLEHALLVARRGGVGLGAADRRFPGDSIAFQDQQIGECPADIGGDADGFRSHRWTPRVRLNAEGGGPPGPPGPGCARAFMDGALLGKRRSRIASSSRLTTGTALMRRRV